MQPSSQQKSPLGRMLSFIEFPSITLRFLILDCPTESTLPFYLQEFQRYNVTHIVRCCQPTYSTKLLLDHDIQVHDLPFKDGGVVNTACRFTSHQLN
jgi:protein tyrosine phosphatase type 4A